LSSHNATIAADITATMEGIKDIAKISVSATSGVHVHHRRNVHPARPIRTASTRQAQNAGSSQVRIYQRMIGEKKSSVQSAQPTPSASSLARQRQRAKATPITNTTTARTPHSLPPGQPAQTGLTSPSAGVFRLVSIDVGPTSAT
jgi:hypothetical protein